MKLLVGLGNPGEKYAQTRHNLGFMVADQLLKDTQPVEKTNWSDEKKFKSDIASFEWELKDGKSEKIVLAKPKTFMNNSGMAVALLTNYFKVTPGDIWIIHDELDLPFGTIKIRNGGAAAGHHGVESVIASLNDDKFWRFRLGIGLHTKHTSRVMEEEGGVEKEIARRIVNNVEDHVLGEFSKQELGKLKDSIKRASQAIQSALNEGMQTAMNRFNTK